MAFAEKLPEESGSDLKLIVSELRIVPKKLPRPERGTVEWFDYMYEKLIRKRNQITQGGQQSQADEMYTQLKNQIDTELRKYPNIESVYRTELGINPATNAKIDRFGLISMRANGTANKVKFFKS